ncbi:MAG: hypothetical protein IT447_15500 [Phycisphaerales bacterium]|nr:hypothetical protein [Phycisphaerales bacterium]
MTERDQILAGAAAWELATLRRMGLPLSPLQTLRAKGASPVIYGPEHSVLFEAALMARCRNKHQVRQTQKILRRLSLPVPRERGRREGSAFFTSNQQPATSNQPQAA